MHTTLALPAPGFSTRHFINNALEDKGIYMTATIEINDIPTLPDLVKTGKYNTILAQTTVGDKNSFTTIPIKGISMDRQAVIVTMKETYEKKATRAFCNIIEAQGY